MGGFEGGVSFVATVENCRQQAEVVVRVIRPMCPRTDFICFLVQRAIIGLSDPIAAVSQWPDQQDRLIVLGEEGLELTAQVQHGTWGR